MRCRKNHAAVAKSSDAPKLRAAVAKRICSSQNVQNTSVSEHFSNIRCAKIPRLCGEKHLFKSKCTKHVSFGALFKHLMRQNCAPLWFKSKCTKHVSFGEELVPFHARSRQRHFVERDRDRCQVFGSCHTCCELVR